MSQNVRAEIGLVDGPEQSSKVPHGGIFAAWIVLQWIFVRTKYLMVAAIAARS